jgi:hypoxanthine-DNA glycosylase
MPFGLSIESISKITEAISSHHAVSRITLFGSRAMDHPKPGSDIDIAVSGEGLRLEDFLNFSLQIDLLELPYKVDLIDQKKITDPDLIDHILRVGIILFENGISRQYGLPPIINPNSSLLILGSFPSQNSLDRQQYYATSSNAFWKVLCAVLDEPFSPEYSLRKELLKRHRIALWDVLESCLRPGSGDKAIQFELPNDLSTFFKDYPSLTHLLFNGSNPIKFFTKHGQNEGSLVVVPPLPSTSALYTRLTVKEKIDRWNKIRFIPNL